MTMKASLSVVHLLIKEHEVFSDTDIVFLFSMKDTHENKKILYNASSKTLSDVFPDNDEIENGIVIPLPDKRNKPIKIIFED